MARAKYTASLLSRKYDISASTLYAGNNNYGILKEPKHFIKEIANDYILIYMEGEPPIVDITDFDDYEGDPTDFFGELNAEIVSLREKKIVGTCVCVIYYFLDMIGYFDSDFIMMRLDDVGADDVAVGEELLKRKKLRYLMTEDADTNLLHIDKLKVAKAHRGQDLGLKTLSVLIDHAATALHCGYAIMRPCPLAFEPGDIDRGASKQVFARARKKLFDYYQRLDFIRPSARSNYLYKEIGPRLRW